MVAAPCSASCDRTQTVSVALVALLLLPQWCSVFVMSVTVSYILGKTTRKFLADGRENINKISRFFG